MKIIKKPWGSEEIIFKQNNFQVKLIKVNDGCQLSLQYHKVKEETVTLFKGKGNIMLPDRFIVCKKGRQIIIFPGVPHRFIGVQNAEFLEMSYGEDSDIVRIEDDYQRETK